MSVVGPDGRPVEISRPELDFEFDGHEFSVKQKNALLIWLLWMAHHARNGDEVAKILLTKYPFIIKDKHERQYWPLTKTKEEWMKEHQCCPKCGSPHKINRTIQANPTANLNDYDDTVSRAMCLSCNWVGLLKDLTPRKEGDE